MLNSVHICGRLTADPELKHTQSGIAVASFTVAVDRDYTKDNERQADFIYCTAWRGTAEFICRNFCKGKMIIVSGRIQTSSYTSQDGQKRYKTDVVCDEVYFAGDKKKSNSGEADAVASGDFHEITEDDGDLPF